MKILQISSLLYQLPDDFKGDIYDALQLVIANREAIANREGVVSRHKVKLDRDARIGKVYADQFDNFLDMVDQGKKLSCIYTIEDLPRHAR